MRIKEVSARIILDSRKEETIEVSVNALRTSAPSGKSKGKHEKPCYLKDIQHDVDYINKLQHIIDKFPEFYYFGDLEKLEKIVSDKIGANTLFALEASILKAIAAEKKKELWQVIDHKLKFNLKTAKFPRIISNTIGGGAHSSLLKIKPDFQEFLFSCNKNPGFSYEMNKKAYEKTEILLQDRTANVKKNDENALTCDLDNEKILQIMNEIKSKIKKEAIVDLEIGIDVAASQFFKKKGKKGNYEYSNRIKTLTREEQIKYIIELANKYNLFYIEDPLDEEDFQGFSEIVKNVNCFVVGDDLTVTNFERVKKAIELEAINAVIIKPNQTGSLIEVRRIVDLCNKKGIKTIVSHRSGETNESFIADLAFGLQADYIKTPVIGEERFAKVKRLMQIEGSLKK
jgi:enolase